MAPYCAAAPRWRNTDPGHVHHRLRRNQNERRSTQGSTHGAVKRHYSTSGCVDDSQGVIRDTPKCRHIVSDDTSMILSQQYIKVCKLRWDGGLSIV